MDDLTAVAFAQAAFERAHPDAPDWLPRYTGTGCRVDRARDVCIVSFAWMPRSSRTGSESYFVCEVNAWNAETEVLVDVPLEKYQRADLEPYEPE